MSECAVFMNDSILRRLFLLIGMVFAIAAMSDSAIAERVEKQGVVIDFSVTPVSAQSSANKLVAGSDAMATFRISDARTEQPLSGMRPRAWFSARHSEMVANETECVDKIRSLASGNLAKRADIDLNSYQVLTLNHDKTITVINPLVAFNTTKLESVIVLPANGADWALSKDRHFLYVTMPEASAIAIIDTLTRKLISTVPTGEKTTPRRIAIQPDGRHVWVGLDGAAQVVVIDTSTQQITGMIPVGNGLHQIAFTADSRFAYVTNSEADTVTVIDMEKMTKVADIDTDKTPVAIVYGSASRLIYVSAINGDAINVLDPGKQQMVKRIPVTSRGVVALNFEPSGRYLFAVNQLSSTVQVIDSATHAIVTSTSVVKEPDQVIFSDRYAYVRGLGSEKFSLIDVAALKDGQIAMLDIQAGRLPPSATPDEIGVASMIAPTPGGNAVLIANAADRMLYYYQEGMMAPMGTFTNYKRIPLALMILDRSLTETAPGVYSAPMKLGKAGRFDVPLLIDQPRLMNCFQITVAEQPGTKHDVSKRTIRIEAIFENRHFLPGQLQTLDFRIMDSVTKQPVSGLKDVQALLIEPPGEWQQRRRLEETGEGIYSLRQSFPHAGSYRLLLEIPSRGLRYTDSQPTLFHVGRVEGGEHASKISSTIPRGE